MEFSYAKAHNASEIKKLLAADALVHADIASAQLEHFRLGWDGARLVAVVGLEIKGQSALLRSLVVDAEYRDRNIATRLVGEIEDYARSLKVGTIYLLTMTAKDFFMKNGYRSTARESAPADIQETTEFQSLCPASATCMVKNIGEN